MKKGDFKMQPGMQTTIIIGTGDRSMLGYLMRPPRRRFSMALGEQ